LHAADFDETTHAGIVFIQIPAGTFLMGTSDSEKSSLEGEKHWTRFEECERPSRKVTLTKPFLIGKYEVTQKQWTEVMSNNPSAFKGDDLPVESVSWEDAQQFIKKLNAVSDAKFRLPSEAEWEYACRAGSTNLYSTVAGREEVLPTKLVEYAWSRSNAENKTHPVGTRKPNVWGLHDLHGNVWEWCRDWFDPDFYKRASARDPVNDQPAIERVMRGGSWFLEARTLRSAYRSGQLPSAKSQYVGFRLARDL
jgi:formylglycine-generating enzyme required for sulfatase activity